MARGGKRGRGRGRGRSRKTTTEIVVNTVGILLTSGGTHATVTPRVPQIVTSSVEMSEGEQ